MRMRAAVAFEFVKYGECAIINRHQPRHHTVGKDPIQYASWKSRPTTSSARSPWMRSQRSDARMSIHGIPTL